MNFLKKHWIWVAIVLVVAFVLFYRSQVTRLARYAAAVAAYDYCQKFPDQKAKFLELKDFAARSILNQPATPPAGINADEWQKAYSPQAEFFRTRTFIDRLFFNMSEETVRP